MSTYFDPIMQQETVLEESTTVYLVKLDDDKFSIKAISSGLDVLPSDPTTHAEEYWLIPTKSLMNLPSDNPFFEESKLTHKPITKEQVVKFFKFDPNDDKTPPKKFNTSIKEELNDTWANDVVQEEFSQNPDLFPLPALIFFRPSPENNPDQQDNANPMPALQRAIFLLPFMDENGRRHLIEVTFNLPIDDLEDETEDETEDEEDMEISREINQPSRPGPTP